ncbi:MFS transporter [Mycetocola spongiae]|uniref:MFS transporter n=1 Tax=Mycetocola spongiae TaxID=2859226 RepID=UPI001CF214EE|nr:MFS transporter [Mycetocola spongiae]UCR89127.1 MFS transporter [Mycetocola spongiae]
MFANAPAIAANALSRRRRWAALAVLMLPVLLVSVDNTVLNFAVPAISEALRPTGNQLLWIIDIYPLVLAGLLVPMGSIGDRFGRRRLLMIGSIGFGVVSVLAAFSPSPELLIAARALLGFFGAMLMPSTLSLLRNIFTDRNELRLAIAIWASAFSAGSALGPIVGGLLLNSFPWGSVFLLAVPMLLPLVILAPLLLPESKDPNPGKVDLLSIPMALLTMAPFVFGIKWLATHGMSAVGIGTLLFGVLLGYLFVRRQRRISNPMLDMTLFHRGQFSGAVLVNLLSVIALVGGLFFVSQHLQLVLGMTPFDAAMVLIPGLVITIISGLGIVFFSKRFRASIVIPASLLFSIAGYAVIALSGGDIGAWGIAVAFSLLGLGIGAAETVSNELILASAPPAKAGAASAVSETAYELGAVLGTATIGTILTASYRSNVVLPEGLTPDQQLAASETLGGAVNVSGEISPDLGAVLLESARHAFDSGAGVAAWIGVALVAGAAIIAAFTLRKTT